MNRSQCIQYIESCTQARSEFEGKKAQYESLSGPLSDAVAALMAASGNISRAASELGKNYTSNKTTKKVGTLQEQCSKISSMVSTLTSAMQAVVERVRTLNYKIEEMNSLIQQYNAILPTLKE